MDAKAETAAYSLNNATIRLAQITEEIEKAEGVLERVNAQKEQLIGQYNFWSGVQKTCSEIEGAIEKEAEEKPKKKLEEKPEKKNEKSSKKKKKK